MNSFLRESIITWLGMVLAVLLLCSSCSTATKPVAREYPRMPDEYRNNNDSKGSGNPIGMSVYDAAETEAEEDYFGAEVVPLEESKRILTERKKQKIEQQKNELNQGGSK